MTSKWRKTGKEEETSSERWGCTGARGEGEGKGGVVGVATGLGVASDMGVASGLAR